MLKKPLLPCIQPEGESWSVRVSCTNVAVEFCMRVRACPVAVCVHMTRGQMLHGSPGVLIFGGTN